MSSAGESLCSLQIASSRIKAAERNERFLGEAILLFSADGELCLNRNITVLVLNFPCNIRAYMILLPCA